MNTKQLKTLVLTLLVLSITISGGCRKVDGTLKRKMPVPTAPAPQTQGRDIIVGVDYPTIDQSLRNARSGDTVLVSASPISYSTATGERFPLVVPAGVTVRVVHGGGAAPYATIDMDNMNAVPAFIMSDGTTVENIKITSSSGAYDYEAIDASNTTGAKIKDVDIRTRAGVKGNDSRDLVIKGSTFYPGPNPQTSGAPTKNAITLKNCTDFRIRGGTIIGFQNNIDIDNSTGVVEENIITNGGVGISIDGASIASVDIQNNDVWGNVIYYNNATTDTPFVPTVGNNISADPLFVSVTNGDLRLLPSSPCATAGKNGGPIGARKIVQVLEAKLTKTSPIGVALKSNGTKILEFEIATGDKDVELYGFAWKIISTRNITVEMQLVEETTGGNKTLDTIQYPLNNGTWSTGLHVSSTIQANSRKVYFLSIDTTGMQTNDTLHAEIWSLDVKEGGQVRFLPMFTGNVISF